MIVGVARETVPGERRVALVPASVQPLVKAGCEVLVEQGAGDDAGFLTSDYTDKGASAVSRDEVFAKAEIILQVIGPGTDAGAANLGQFREGQIVIGMQDPLGNPHGSAAMAARGVTSFSLEMVPRITRAQSMDVLSSMATVAGYQAVLEAASHLPRLFPMMMTAAGTLAPTKAFVVGAGVAGLQAIATAKRLGAQVTVFDTRPVVKEQVESLGARFVSLATTAEAETEGGYATEQSEDFYRHEQVIIDQQLADTDVVICTAQIFGKRAPLLITEEMVQTMRSGSVIVDLAAEQGGNCELTVAGKTVERYGISIHGESDLPGSLSYHASEMYSRNVTALLSEMIKDGKLVIDIEDDVIKGTLLTHAGKVMNQHVRDLLDRDKEEV
ncbi:MAG: Re/Si-specific NAD(P)(+) transhydrogenase subunit alpha [Candidatus Marinimicrobia bacterium]|nr:Re/Si-specific NAD(P)(+) transhydrogenase subunit alpha [Candidatus Neomarinimicrobiota bacterium]